MADNLDGENSEYAICHYDKQDGEWRPLWMNPNSAVLALRQAADTEEELRTMRSTWLTPETAKALFEDCKSKVKEIDELKARLSAVERACATHVSMRCKSQCKIAGDGVPKSLNGKPCYKCNVCDLTPEELAQTSTATEILRALTDEEKNDESK